MLLNSCKLQVAGDHGELLVLAMEDVTQRRRSGGRSEGHRNLRPGTSVDTARALC